jgi:two-component system KDP operon response regulator KdpE
MNGTEVCERLREWTHAPIIVLSARDDQRDKVAALDKGADDYLTKPFGIDELMARVRVALRHGAQLSRSADPVIQSGALAIDLARHMVSLGEFKLLAYLARNADRVLTHRAILIEVWGMEHADRIEYLRVYMRQLRAKLEDDPHNPAILQTEPGVGYRFVLI